MSQRGSILKRGSTYTTYWWVRTPEGKRRQRSKGGFQRKKDAQGHLNDVLARIGDGRYVELSKLRVAQYLQDEWLPAKARSVRANTIASYRSVVEGWIIPELGGSLLAALNPRTIGRFYERVENAPRRDGRGGNLSGRTAQLVATVMNMALNDALKAGFISRNPAIGVARPRGRHREMQAWSTDEARRFLVAVRDTRLYSLWQLALLHGLRRGELLGLRWSDLDLDARQARIVQTRIAVGYQVQVGEPKTEKSRRTLELDDRTIGVLRQHRRRQVEERLGWGEGWTDSGYVFVREDGTPLHPQSVSDLFERLIKPMDLPRIRLHDLRHTAAVIALERGEHPKVVQEMLGHSSIQITLDTYSHVSPALKRQTAERQAAAVFGAASTEERAASLDSRVDAFNDGPDDRVTGKV